MHIVVIYLFTFILVLSSFILSLVMDLHRPLSSTTFVCHHMLPLEIAFDDGVSCFFFPIMFCCPFLALFSLLLSSTIATHLVPPHPRMDSLGKGASIPHFFFNLNFPIYIILFIYIDIIVILFWG